jgi:hypothetical protein
MKTPETCASQDKGAMYRLTAMLNANFVSWLALSLNCQLCHTTMQIRPA